MSKQGVKLIIGAVILVAVFAIFKGLFVKTDSESASGVGSPLTEAIHEGAFLVDVRTPAEFAQGSAKGAINIPLNTVADELAQFKDKDKIVVFCKSGNRSGQAKSILEKNGFQNVINGGTWQNVNQIVNESPQ